MLLASLTLLVAPLAALPPAASTELESVQHFGAAHPLRLRLEAAFGEPDLREDASSELAPVSDVQAFDVEQVADKYDIPVEMQPLVADYLRFFQGPGRKWFRVWLERSTRYLPVMQPILAQYGLPADTVYLAMIESGFSTQAYSRARASGPWQFIPPTGKSFGLKQDFWVDERRDPIKSTHAAAQFLKRLHESLGHWYLAWAGYNTGGVRIRRLTEKKSTKDFWELSDGRGLAKETRHYVPKLIAAALIAKHPAAFGFKEEEFRFLPPMEWDEAKLEEAIDLQVLAKSAGITEDELRELNPELNRWSTPPASAEEPYLLRLPKGRSEVFTENLAQVPKSERFRFSGHQVQKGDTLSGIAAKYGSNSEAIMRMNGIKSARGLKLNQILMIPLPGGSSTPPSNLARFAPPATRSSGASHRSTGPGSARVHKLRSGETLWKVAQRYGVSVDQLKRWNHIRDDRSLRSGQRLKVARP